MQNTNSNAIHAWGAAIVVLVLIFGFVAVGQNDEVDLSGLATNVDLANAIRNISIEVPEIQGDFSDLCENTNGCNDAYKVSDSKRDAAIDRVRDLLEEDDNRDLHKFLNDYYDIDENEDVDSVSLHRIGRVRANEEFDSFFDLSDTLEIEVEYAIEVSFYEDGNASDDVVKYFKVTATLYDLEDGLDDGEIKNVDVEPIAKDAALTSN